MDFFLRKSCISAVAARVTGNSPSAPASPTEEVDRWKVCTWSNWCLIQTNLIVEVLYGLIVMSGGGGRLLRISFFMLMNKYIMYYY